MDTEFKACFENCGIGTMMDIAVPLVNHLIPSNITDYAERNNYLKENFVKMFMGEYWFHPTFTVKDSTVTIEVREDFMYLHGFGTLNHIFKKINEKMKGFKVFVKLDMTIQFE